MEESLQKILDKIIEGGVDILIAVIVMYIGFKLSKLFVKLIKKGRGFNRLDKSVQSFTVSFVSISSKLLVILIVATMVGIPTTSLVTIVGSTGVAIGLALQGGLSNIAGGIIILINKPFEVGDWIEVGDKSGTVTNISMFYTELTPVNNRKIVIPNGQITNTAIENYSSNKDRRLDLEFGVSYDNDIEKVKKVLLDVVTSHEKIDTSKEVLVRVCRYDDSAVIYRVRAWTTNQDYWDVFYDIQENVKKSFDKNKIEIPYNQVDVHMKK